MFQSFFVRERDVEMRIELTEDQDTDHPFLLVFQDMKSGVTTTNFMTRSEMDRLCGQVLGALNEHDRARIERELK